ncbi:putative glycylpeptide n-tetradecanoyltransferase protein [Golovinomyces cichoracearum]|uniref:Putative glycylpeptide n-tetradecanoyltransferase protein n=1 Tax=Golovinomyces cichoracearum TaxID=62708 RepID=A0A420J9G2_9PEZI|nr:putative glycylpeptide n-tetradecanoyltransferase protein [Golovinomyces cichoracearum]
MAQPRPSVKEILANPSYPDVVWKLIPSQSGKLSVATGRGGPINIDWEVHGTGNIKLVWIMGLGSIKVISYLVFGERFRFSDDVLDDLAKTNSEVWYVKSNGVMMEVVTFHLTPKVTIGILGIGKSDKPLMRYSTSEMARDALELLDHIGWTSDRQLHVVGVSLGGMIAQELAYLIPERICSLNLLSTAAFIQNTTTFIENMQTRIRMLIPKSLDRSLDDASRALFSEKWLSAPDCTNVPKAESPNVEFPPSGQYGKFSTNYERYAAHELRKRLDPNLFGRKGFLLQLIAAGWHHKSPEQLKELGDKVGRERILVLHGTEDRMITVLHGQKLIEWLQPGTAIIKEGACHVIMLEEEKYHNELIENMIEKCEGLK